MNWLAIAQFAASFIGTLSSAGPWGIAAMVLGSGGIIAGVAYLISKWNKSVDAGDLERSGADAGNTAVDLKNQADANRDYENQSRDEILKQGPPKP
jgi:hypothetical protein